MVLWPVFVATFGLVLVVIGAKTPGWQYDLILILGGSLVGGLVAFLANNCIS